MIVTAVAGGPSTIAAGAGHPVGERRDYRPGMRIPTAPVVAGSLVAGYLVARETKVRPLGGLVLAGTLAWAVPRWARTAGPAAAAVCTATYLGSFGGSHPLAKKIGPWGSVLSAAALSGAVAAVVGDRGRS